MNAVLPQANQQPLRVQTKTARLLVGWMDDNKIVQTLQLPYAGVVPQVIVARAATARQQIAARAELSPPAPSQDIPVALHNYLGGLGHDPGNIRLVDLRSIRAVQPHVFLDAALRFGDGVDPQDLEAVARITIPPPRPVTFINRPDAATKTWAITSGGQNLKVGDPIQGQGPNGLQIFGFGVTEINSNMCVTQVGAEFILVDGYHRAVGLLHHGINVVPVVMNSQPTGLPVALPDGMFPPQIYLDTRAPRVSDYMDEAVSTSAEMPVIEKLVVVQATEIASYKTL